MATNFAYHWSLWGIAVIAAALAIDFGCSLPVQCQASAEDAPSAWTGGPGTVGTAQYMSSVQNKVERNWVPPKGTTFNTVYLRFKVHKNGSVSDVQISGSSGSTEVDQAALAAVQKCAPYPSPPAGLPDPMDLQITLDPPAGSAPSYTPQNFQLDLPPNPEQYGQQPGYPAQQPVYPQQQPAYSGQQSSYPQQQPRYPAQQPGYPTQRPSYATQQQNYPSQQPDYSQQQPSYSQQQPAYSQQQPGYPQPQPSYSQQQPVRPRKQPAYSQQPQQQPEYPAQPTSQYQAYPGAEPSNLVYPTTAQPSPPPPKQTSPPRSKQATAPSAAAPSAQPSAQKPVQTATRSATQAPTKRSVQPPAQLLPGRSGPASDIPAAVPPAYLAKPPAYPSNQPAARRPAPPAASQPPPAATAPPPSAPNDLFAFLSDLQRRVRQTWSPPPGSESLRIVARFRVQIDGQLTQLRLDKSSMYPEVDQAALAAIERAAPFSHLPPDCSGEIEMQVAFGPKGPKAAVVGY